MFWDSFFDRHVLGTVIRVRSRISDYPIDTERGRGVGYKWNSPLAGGLVFKSVGNPRVMQRYAPMSTGSYFVSDEAEKAAKWDAVEEFRKSKQHLLA